MTLQTLPDVGHTLPKEALPPHSPQPCAKEAFPALKGDDQSLQEGKKQSRTSLPLSHFSNDQDKLCPTHGTDEYHVPSWCSCAKPLLLGTGSCSAKSCPAGTWNRALSTPLPPQLPLPRLGRWQQRSNDSSPAPKNLFQGFNITRKAPNRSSLPSAVCLNNRVPIMGCLKGEGQSQGSELSSASLAAMTKAQRTHHPRGLSCWHRAELSKDTLVNTLPWPSPLTRAPERGREKPLSANRHPSLSLDTRTSPSKTSPASLSGLPVEPKNPLAADEDRCHIKERLNSHKPENLCSGVLTRSSW